MCYRGVAGRVTSLGYHHKGPSERRPACPVYFGSAEKPCQPPSASGYRRWRLRRLSTGPDITGLVEEKIVSVNPHHSVVTRVGSVPIERTSNQTWSRPSGSRREARSIPNGLMMANTPGAISWHSSILGLFPIASRSRSSKCWRSQLTGICGRYGNALKWARAASMSVSLITNFCRRVPNILNYFLRGRRQVEMLCLS